MNCFGNYFKKKLLRILNEEHDGNETSSCEKVGKKVLVLKEKLFSLFFNYPTASEGTSEGKGVCVSLTL